MKKLLLLFDQAAIDDKLADPAALVFLMAKIDPSLEITWACWEDLIFFVSSKQASITIRQTRKDLSYFDIVYFRRAQLNVDLRLATAIYLHKNAIAFVDQEAYQEFGSVSKLTQYFRCWEHDLPIPETFFGLKPSDVGLLTTRKLMFPLVVKSLAGTRGNDNHLVEDEQRLLDLIKNQEARYLVQRFIPNDRDYRILLFGYKPLMTIERVRGAETHKNNTSKGAASCKISIERLPKAAIKHAIQAAHIFGRNIAGVDLVIDAVSGKHYIFEVNRSPQIENSSFELEKAKLLVDYLSNVSLEAKQ